MALSSTERSRLCLTCQKKRRNTKDWVAKHRLKKKMEQMNLMTGKKKAGPQRNTTANANNEEVHSEKAADAGSFKLLSMVTKLLLARGGHLIDSECTTLG